MLEDVTILAADADYPFNGNGKTPQIDAILDGLLPQNLSANVQPVEPVEVDKPGQVFKGEQGSPGKSADELAVEQGYQGSLADWVKLLQERVMRLNGWCSLTTHFHKSQLYCLTWHTMCAAWCRIISTV